MSNPPSDRPADSAPDDVPGASHPLPADPLLHPVSRRAAAVWNIVFAYAAMFLVLLRNLALVPLYIRFIGEDEYNAWLISGGVLMQLTNLDFGLMGVLLQQVAAAYGRRNREQLERLVGTGLVLAAAISLIMGAATAAVSPILPKVIDVSPDIARRLIVCFLMVAMANTAQLFGFAISGLLKSLQRTFLAGLFVVLSELASLGATTYLIFAGWGLYAIGIGLIVRATVELGGTLASFLWIGVWRLQIRPQWDRSQLRELGKFSFYQFFTQIAGRVKTSIDSFLVGVILGKTAGGAYALTTRAHDTVRMFSQGFGSSFGPAMAHLHGEGTTSRFKEVLVLLFKLQALTAAIGYGGVIVFNRSFMNLWVGPEFYSGALVSNVAAIGGIAYLLTTCPYEAIFTRGGFSLIAKAVWIEAVLRLSLMVMLLYTLGVVGAPLGSFLTQAFVLLVPLTWLVGKQLKFSRADFIGILQAVFKLMAGPLILVAAFALAMPTATSWTMLIAEAGCFVAACLIVTGIVDFDLLKLILRRGRMATAA